MTKSVHLQRYEFHFAEARMPKAYLQMGPINNRIWTGSALLSEDVETGGTWVTKFPNPSNKTGGQHLQHHQAE